MLILLQETCDRLRLDLVSRFYNLRADRRRRVSNVRPRGFISYSAYRIEGGWHQTHYSLRKFYMPDIKATKATLGGKPAH
jgi:hypothetical protein